MAWKKRYEGFKAGDKIRVTNVVDDTIDDVNFEIGEIYTLKRTNNHKCDKGSIMWFVEEITGTNLEDGIFESEMEKV